MADKLTVHEADSLCNLLKVKLAGVLCQAITLPFRLHELEQTLSAYILLDEHDDTSTLFRLLKICIEPWEELTVQDLHALALLPDRLALCLIKIHCVIDLQCHSLAGHLMGRQLDHSVGSAP